MKWQIPSCKWIWVSDPSSLDKEENNLVFFRREFELEQPKSCVLRVSADARYKLYVNGKLVALGPAKGDRSVWYYDEVEITAYLRSGKNALCAEVLQVPTLHNKGNHSLARTYTPGLYIEENYDGLKEPVDQTVEDIARDTMDLTSHGRLGLTADSSWLAHVEKNVHFVAEAFGFSPLMFMEEAAGDPALHGWQAAPGYQSRCPTPWPRIWLRRSSLPSLRCSYCGSAYRACSR